MSLEQQYTAILGQLGEDVSREGLLDTPKRAAKAMQYLCRGYTQSLEEIVNGALFASDNDEMVIVRDIELYSLCEHHLLPFTGNAWVGYIPNGGGVVGLSKLARLVEHYARQPQIQERLTSQITDALVEHLEPQGAACVIRATHSCMTMRGVKKPGAVMTTSSMLGMMRDDGPARAEFMALLGLPV